MRYSDTTARLFAALAQVQGAVANIERDRTVAFKQVSYTYATLAAIRAALREPMREAGLSLTYPVGMDGDVLTVGCRVTWAHVPEDGEPLVEWMEQELHVRVQQGTGRNWMQDLKSTITYARRTLVICAFGLADEDDDGQASKAEPPPEDDPLDLLAEAWRESVDVLEQAHVVLTGHPPVGPERQQWADHIRYQGPRPLRAAARRDPLGVWAVRRGVDWKRLHDLHGMAYGVVPPLNDAERAELVEWLDANGGLDALEDVARTAAVADEKPEGGEG